MTKEISRKEIEELENNNEHGRVAIELCKSFGTYREYETIKEINKSHDERGHILYDEQRARDEIIIKYYELTK